ncbi:unnamed protein product [Cylindrotheca closterium]|uniref:3'-5' exonuclease domain-containing protein n=1 Tax=Cylindrotheca closterium TaxID=2856 RepID=A0AAD2FGA9_9STRA|nr:unnamed protein product [Cylindrotheca closterium]
MMTQWQGVKTLSLVLFASILHVCSSYLHEQSFNSQRFTLEDVLPPLVPLATDGSSMYSYGENSNHCTSVPVVYTNDPSSISLWLSENVPDGKIGIIGFDTESLPRYYRRCRKKKPFENTATVQLATSSSCLVVHLVRDNFGSPSSGCAELLQRIIADPKYIKAGCAIDEDLMDLHSLWGGLDAKSRLDLSTTTGCDHSNRVGLKALAARTLSVDLPKVKRITLSDWTKVPLTKGQIIYSARDAWAGAAIAEQLAKNDPDVFSPESLMELLRFELPIAELGERKRRRDEAKQELRKILKPYKRDRRRHLPKHLKREVARLRRIIKNRVVESTCLVNDDVDCDMA